MSIDHSPKSPSQPLSSVPVLHVRNLDGDAICDFSSVLHAHIYLPPMAARFYLQVALSGKSSAVFCLCDIMLQVRVQVRVVQLLPINM